MVCVTSCSLDGFIITAPGGKVNGGRRCFTICLQWVRFFPFSFINRSKNIIKMHIAFCGLLC